MEMEMPIVSISEQEEMIKSYNEELGIYKTTIREAENRWSNIKSDIYKHLI
jgi:hypothetical protein